MSRRRPMPYPHLVRVGRELSTAYKALETATAILRLDRGMRSRPVGRGLKAMIAIDEVRVTLEPLVRAWVGSEESVTALLYGHEAIARPAPEPEPEPDETEDES